MVRAGGDDENDTSKEVCERKGAGIGEWQEQEDSDCETRWKREDIGKGKDSGKLRKGSWEHMVKNNTRKKEGGGWKGRS